MTESYPFSLAVISDEVSQDPRRIAAFAREYNLQAVEIRSLWDCPPQALNKERIQEIKRIFDDAGLAVCGIASPFLKCDYGDPQQFNDHLEILRKCVELADTFGTKFIRGFTFWRKADLAQNIAPVLDRFQSVLQVLETTNQYLLIENEASTNTATGKETSEFLKQLNHPRVKGIWDPANCIYSPVPEKPFPDGYEIFKDRILHVHVKDAIRRTGQEPECVPIGEGQVDWLGQFKALKENGYTGYLSLETHWRATEYLSQDELERPGGKKFSEGGEYASGICVKNIQAMLSQLEG